MDSLAEDWRRSKTDIENWLAGNDKVFELYNEWEKTTILNPYALSGSLQGYRGDHYALASRLGKIAISGQDDGRDITASDTDCAFGKWRVSFDSDKELFSSNPVLVKAMSAMVEPHKAFHQSAHRLQELVRQGAAKNRKAISEAYLENLQLAKQVISTFDVIIGEVAKAQEAYLTAEAFALNDLFTLQDAVISSLDQLIAKNNSNLDTNSTVVVDDAQCSVSILQAFSAGFVVVGILLVLFLKGTIKSSLTGPLTRIISSLSDDANKMGTAAKQFSLTSDSLAEGATRQEASIEETSTALEEIASMSRKTATNANDANDLMQENAHQIEEGSKAVAKMGEAMNDINEYSTKIIDIIKTKLSRRSRSRPISWL